MEILNNKICKVKPKDVKNGKVIIPYGVKAISSAAFWKNYNLEEITIPNNILSIGTGAFQECNNLKTVVFNQRTQKIYLHPSVFKNTGIEMIEFPTDFLYKLPFDLFAYCLNLKEIYIPSSVDKLSLSVFRGCIFLDKIHWKGRIYSYDDLLTYKQIF